MRAVFAILPFVFFCAVLSARADVILSGHVLTSNEQGGSCFDSGTSPSNLDLACSGSDPQSSASVSGTASPFGGSLQMSADVFGPESDGVGSAGAVIDLTIDENLLVTGGTGPTTVYFVANRPTFEDGGVSCSFTIDGATTSCYPLASETDTFASTVQYNVPFSFQLNMEVGVDAITNGEPSDGRLSFGIDTSGVGVTPEPSSILFLMPGLAGVVFAARSRACRVSR